VWQFTRELVSELGDAEPNETHRVLVDWERRGLVSMVATQNIDGLHQVLDAVQTGHISNRHIVANATRVAAASLLKRGYLEPDNTGLHPSTDVSLTITATSPRRSREHKNKQS